MGGAGRLRRPEAHAGRVAQQQDPPKRQGQKPAQRVHDGVQDEGEQNGDRHRYQHLAPEGERTVDVVDPARTDGTLLQLCMLGDGRLEIGRSWRSEVYGAKCEAGHIAMTRSGRGRQRVATLLVPSSAHARLATDERGEQVAAVSGPRFTDRITWRATAPTIDAGGVRSDAECVIETSDATGTPQRLYLLGATHVEGAGLERQTLTAGEPFSARHELGRWWPEPFRTGSTGQA